jgi:hypothetical protein
MARLSFRQGIVRHQTDTLNTPTFLQKVGQFVNLIVSPDPTIVTFVHGTTNYLFTEHVTTLEAWGPFIPGNDVWLYWDLNRVSGIRTFGYTPFEPVEAAIAPITPGTGQMWFNTAFNLWFEWNGAAWVEVIRVFAAKYANSTTLTSMSIDTPIFTGTQVGLTTSINVGSLMYDGEGKPILNSNKQFFTTEDVFTTGVPSGASLKVNNIILRAQAQQPIAAYNVVAYSDFNKIIPALPFTVLNRIYGITEEGANVDDVVNVVTEGIIFNQAWDWPTAGAAVNAPVFIDNTGQLVLTPSGSDDLAVGAVIGPQSILFDPTLYGLSSSNSGGGSGTNDHNTLLNLSSDDHIQYHTNTRGDIRYYTKALSDSTFAPIIHQHLKSDITDFAHTHLKTEITDFAHTHLKTEITDFAHQHLKTEITDFAHTHLKTEITDFAHTHTEADITDLKSYVELAGGTMTGVLTLVSNPNNPLEAATKSYVDALVNGLLWRDPINDPNIGGIDINDPSTVVGLGATQDRRVFTVGTTPTGLFSSFAAGTIVRWNGTIWVSWDGSNGTVQVGDRFGVAMEPAVFPPNVDVALTSHVGKIITITDNTPGSILFNVHVPVEPEAVFVNDSNSDHFSHTYSFVGTHGTGTYGSQFKWIEIASITAFSGGTNVDIATGNIINVSPQGIASGLDADLWDGQQTNITGLLDQQILQYNLTSSSWENTTLSINTSCIIDSDADTYVSVGGTALDPCTDSGTNDVLITAGNNIVITTTIETQVVGPIIRLDSQGTAPLLLFNTDSTNYVSLKAPTSIVSDFTLTLPPTGGNQGQVLTTDGSGITTFEYKPYDIPFSKVGAVVDTDIINRIVIPRSVTLGETSFGTHYGYCDVAPITTPAVFTVFTASQATPDTFVSRGTITFAVGSRTATAISLPTFNVVSGDHVIVQSTSANGIEGPHIMIAGFSIL